MFFSGYLDGLVCIEGRLKNKGKLGILDFSLFWINFEVGILRVIEIVFRFCFVFF